ncbi:Mu transposase domain-containing protein [Steroidobacter gossypii]|uniref:Mu transposase domain-containing protein n=1 Tax=Steroidobacter gossypii TaxID=2805490 RepID=UPI003899A27C
MPTVSQRSFAQEGRRSRIVASDYLLSFRTNRYSVPFPLIGQTVELQARDGQLTIYHRGQCVAEHPMLEGHQLRILPEQGPGAIARTRATALDWRRARYPAVSQRGGRS